MHLSVPEAVLALASAALVLARWVPPAVRRVVTIGTAVVAAGSGVVVVVAGMRWQLVPVLAIAAVALGVTFVRPRARWWLAAPGTALALLVVASGPVAAWAFPVPVFPVPSSPVGTTVREWTDQARPETATDDPDDHRTVVAQLWYPAAPTTGRKALYLGRTTAEARTVAAALAAQFGLPGFLLDDVARARTAAFVDAPFADGRFPVVLFSPGLGSVRTQNTAWATDLAARGYVVVGLDHPYDSAAVMLRDGSVVRSRVVSTGDHARDLALATGWTAVRAADLSFVLTKLGELDGHIAVDRAAVTGHSIGGAAALQAARQDARFMAAIDLDGYPYDPPGEPIRQPVLGIAGAAGIADNPRYLPRLSAVIERGTAPSYRLTVPGTAHLTFTDAPLYLPPVPWLVGRRGRSDVPGLTAAITAAFLDRTLRGADADPAAVLRTYGDLTVYRGA